MAKAMVTPSDVVDVSTRSPGHVEMLPWLPYPLQEGFLGPGAP
jgi:hypothetical protein